MNKDLLELYSDYLLSSFSHVTATGLSRMTGGEVSHGRITRFLASEEMDSRALWRLVKPLARQVEDDDGVLIIDDTIEEKPYTDESELVCWHYDHSKGRSVKGVNLISALSIRQGRCLCPGGLRARKEEWMGLRREEGEMAEEEPQDQERAVSRDALRACQSNRLKFRYILSDVWYSASETV